MGAFRKGAFDNPPKDGGGPTSRRTSRRRWRRPPLAKPKPPPVVVPAAGSPASSPEAAATKAGGDRSHRGNHIAEPEAEGEGPTGLLTIGRGASGLAAKARKQGVGKPRNHRRAVKQCNCQGGRPGRRMACWRLEQDAGLGCCIESCRDQMVNEMKAVMKQQAQAWRSG